MAKYYYKCNIPQCSDYRWLVWYPFSEPESPTCANCNTPYADKMLADEGSKYD